MPLPSQDLNFKEYSVDDIMDILTPGFQGIQDIHIIPPSVLRNKMSSLYWNLL